MTGLSCISGTETPTSSSENESEDSIAESSTSAIRRSLQQQNISSPVVEDSDSSASSAELEPEHNKWAEYEPPVLPHRVLKFRRLLFEALHATLTIIYETQPHQVVPTPGGLSGRPKEKGAADTVRLDVKEPWMRLSRTVGALKTAAGSSKDVDAASRKCLVVQNSIIPLTEDKQYVRKLARNEAKAIPSLLKSWSKIAGLEVPEESPETHNDSKDHLLAAVTSVPIVILRLAHYALLAAPRDALDLSSLAVRPSDLDDLDTTILCKNVGVAAGEIRRLDMSQNGWKRLPLWIPFPFPSITSLDLTNNASLAHLPLTLLYIPIEKIHIRGTQLGDSDPPFVRHLARPSSASPLSNPPQAVSPMSRTTRIINSSNGPPSLLHTLLRLYATHLRPHYPLSQLTDLPPQLIDMLRDTYTCELCEIYQFSDDNKWLAREVERGWIVSEDVDRRRKHEFVPTQVVKVKGRVCRICESHHLRPA